MERCVKRKSESLVSGFRKAAIVPFDRLTVIKTQISNTSKDTNDDSNPQPYTRVEAQIEVKLSWGKLC